MGVDSVVQTGLWYRFVSREAQELNVFWWEDDPCNELPDVWSPDKIIL